MAKEAASCPEAGPAAATQLLAKDRPEDIILAEITSHATGHRPRQPSSSGRASHTTHPHRHLLDQLEEKASPRPSVLLRLPSRGALSPRVGRNHRD